MVKIIKEDLDIEEALKKKLEFICSFCNTKCEIKKGSIRTIERTNLSYIEPHRIIIKDITFLAFNYETNIYIENLSNKILIKDLNIIYLFTNKNIITLISLTHNYVLNFIH